MKKMISILLAMALVTAGLTACGTNSGQQGSAASRTQEASDSEETAAAEEEPEQAADRAEADTEDENTAVSAEADLQDEVQEETDTTAADETEAGTEDTDSAAGEASGKVLVVYYSATGNTKAVADVIAEQTGADTFELVPVNDYTQEDLNWSDEGSRVNKEHEDESLQDIELVSTTVDNFDSYDTVFIGYPIWWHLAAWPVNNFVKNNDFTGKTVIPFCTSSSSGLGESGTNLAAMAGTGDWQEGQRFSGSAGADEVTAWVDGLDF